tara:strand:+ start:3589 stop:3927 length:339 start_codon:yes stop_codon:yes gene_type:complete
MNKIDDLENIISNTINNKVSIYKKYDPLEKTNELLILLNKESEEFNSIQNISWNKLNNGSKKKLILDYIDNNNLDEHTIVDIKRNMYNGQINKQYTIDYDCELNKINSITKI